MQQMGQKERREIKINVEEEERNANRRMKH
jgi:hypothetical protein